MPDRLLVEAALMAGGSGSSVLNALVHSPSLFPYDLGMANGLNLDGSPRLEFLRQGLDEDIVMLQRSRGR